VARQAADVLLGPDGDADRQFDGAAPEAEVMGPYYPTGYYTTKEAFEADGPKK
jgi:hypothetical protein